MFLIVRNVQKTVIYIDIIVHFKVHILIVMFLYTSSFFSCIVSIVSHSVLFCLCIARDADSSSHCEILCDQL